MGNTESKYAAGDRIETVNGLKGVIRGVGTPDSSNNNAEYQYGVELDKKHKNGHDGYGKFQCKPGHGMIISESFIKRKISKSSHNNECSHNKQHGHRHPNNQQQQVQVQQQVNIRQKVLVNTQELLDQTNGELKLIENYLQCVLKNGPKSNSKELSHLKQKVKIGLRLYHMNTSSMYDDQRKNRYENYENAFKEAQVLIHKFQQNVDHKTSNIDQNIKNHLINRLEPLLNYMVVCLQGIDDDKMPDLPCVMDYEFNQEIASRVCSNIMKVQNHDFPNRRKEIKTNLKTYEDEQNELLKQSKNIQKQQTHNVNVDDILTDINRPMGFPPTHQQIQQQFENEKNQNYTFKEPDLQNGY